MLVRCVGSSPDATPARHGAGPARPDRDRRGRGAEKPRVLYITLVSVVVKTKSKTTRAYYQLIYSEGNRAPRARPCKRPSRRLEGWTRGQAAMLGQPVARAARGAIEMSVTRRP